MYRARVSRPTKPETLHKKQKITRDEWNCQLMGPRHSHLLTYGSLYGVFRWKSRPSVVCNAHAREKGKRFQTRPLYLIIIIIINKCNYATRSRVLHNPEHCNYQMAFIRINAATMTLSLCAWRICSERIWLCERASLAHHDAIIRMYPSGFGMAFGFENQVHFAILQKRAEYWCTHRFQQKGQM